MSFIEACLQGEAQEHHIDLFVETWHEGRDGKDLDLHEFLGMTWAEYQLWSTAPSSLTSILAARRSKPI